MLLVIGECYVDNVMGNVRVFFEVMCKCAWCVSVGSMSGKVLVERVEGGLSSSEERVSGDDDE